MKNLELDEEEISGRGRCPLLTSNRPTPVSSKPTQLLRTCVLLDHHRGSDTPEPQRSARASSFFSRRGRFMKHARLAFSACRGWAVRNAAVKNGHLHHRGRLKAPPLKTRQREGEIESL